MTRPRTLEWIGDELGFLRLIDQTQLPTTLAHRDCRNVEDVWEAIRSLRVRGAPAIGVAAAYGVVLGLQDRLDAFDIALKEVCARLASSREFALFLMTLPAWVVLAQFVWAVWPKRGGWLDWDPKVVSLVLAAWVLGLGLWIVRQIVEAQGGSIAVRSEPGVETVFVVELPRSE